MLTAKQHELIRFIQQRLEETGISPSFEEMKEALDLKSKSGVHRLISALEERGFIRRLPNRARALEVVKLPENAVMGAAQPAPANDSVVSAITPKPVAPAPANDIIDVPLHGRIAAGAPIEAIEGQSSMPVPAALLGPGEHYALEVSGDSMIEAGIFDGDFALVKRTDSARDGEICASDRRCNVSRRAAAGYRGGEVFRASSYVVSRAVRTNAIPSVKGGFCTGGGEQ